MQLWLQQSLIDLNQSIVYIVHYSIFVQLMPENHGKAYKVYELKVLLKIFTKTYPFTRTIAFLLFVLAHVLPLQKQALWLAGQAKRSVHILLCEIVSIDWTLVSSFPTWTSDIILQLGIFFDPLLPFCSNKKHKETQHHPKKPSVGSLGIDFTFCLRPFTAQEATSISP